jgi:hypothetical protein
MVFASSGCNLSVFVELIRSKDVARNPQLKLSAFKLFYLGRG